MDLQFENKNNYIQDLKRRTMGAATNMYFEERHFFLIEADLQVSVLKEAAKQRKALRTEIDKDVTQNSLLCMTEGQRQSLFATIKEMRPIKLGYAGAPNATPITAYNSVDIGGIPNIGCIVGTNRDGTFYARGGGMMTLGFSKTKEGLLLINHFAAYDFTGAFFMNDRKALDASQAQAFTK